jgi:hypothetical protein
LGDKDIFWGKSNFGDYKRIFEQAVVEALVFIHVFECLDIPVRRARARVVYMAFQMNRDVTECFRLLI